MKLGTDRHIPKSACTNCGKVLDGATCVGTDAAPDPGDATICINCGHLMVFDAALGLRELTAEEIRQMAGDERILAVQRARGQLEKKT
jgi:hypothetical protein